MTIATPILPVLDLGVAISFYERLGFAVSEYDATYAIVRCEGHEIAHLQVRDELEKTASLSSIYLNVFDADDWHGRLAGSEVDAGPIEDREWGMREFDVVDPFGNTIRIGTNIS